MFQKQKVKINRQVLKKKKKVGNKQQGGIRVRKVEEKKKKPSARPIYSRHELIQLEMIFHNFSMGLQSGEIVAHSTTMMPLHSNSSFSDPRIVNSYIILMEYKNSSIMTVSK